MNRLDLIGKASHVLMENMRRSVSLTVQELVRTGRLKIDKREIPGLVYILTSSVESGYHSGFKDFMKSVDKALSTTVDDVEKKRNKILKLFGRK